MENCKFQINLAAHVRVDWMKYPETTEEKIKREEMQRHINFKVWEWIHDQKNQQNLINMIFGNNAIII